MVITIKVIIAEKPSLARNIASSIGNMKRADGYMVGNEYIVTWVFGHLFTLCDIEEFFVFAILLNIQTRVLLFPRQLKQYQPHGLTFRALLCWQVLRQFSPRQT